jgi:hypothetical protein
MNKALQSSNQKGDDTEKSYFFKSKRYFKSKEINDRKSSGKRRKRRRSSIIKVHQDDSTIKLFKDIETYLVVKKDVDKFWEAFLRNAGSCLDAMFMEQIVKRWCQAYVFGTSKKLKKTVRPNVKKEK